jgi:glycosyltransferase involved in cell wall biosynthesis
MSPLEQATVPSFSADPPPSFVVSISIIIPALNEARMISKCLASLADLDFPRNHFEVILVDNGSTDDTIKIAESFADRINLRIFQKKGVRISGLRNLGAREAQGEIVTFLDADCLAPQNWLNQILELALTNNAGVLGAHYLLPEDSTWVGRIWHRYQEAPKSGHVSHVPAGDLIMRREDFLKLNGFDETIQTNEDYELCERVRAAGMPVRAYPEIGVIHLGTGQTLRVFFRKQAWHGTHVVKVFLRDIFRSHNLKAVLFAAYTLLCAIVVVAGIIWALISHGPWLFPLIGTAALLLPPVALAMRQIAASGRWADFLPLTALYLTYGLARAKSLLAVKNFF